jgi:hypothetical protein
MIPQWLKKCQSSEAIYKKIEDQNFNFSANNSRVLESEDKLEVSD